MKITMLQSVLLLLGAGCSGSATSFVSEVSGLYAAAMYGFPNRGSLDAMLQPLGSCYHTC